jgi:phosphoribosylformimino-5-aminoimidazole carboxamide ribotide isomerase
MEFRPCIDIHNGKVKQIVGGTLRDEGDRAAENFVSEQDAPFYADMYRRYGLRNGHVILLNSHDSDYYEATKKQAEAALREWPGGLQVGGGITPDNAAKFLDAGASHVIVTSYVFRDGHIDRQRLDRMVAAAGKEHLVLDLSCRKKNDHYYIVTDRWQKFTDTEVTVEALTELSLYCDEFLIHAADVEGKAHGVERGLIPILAEGARRAAEEAIGKKSDSNTDITAIPDGTKNNTADGLAGMKNGNSAEELSGEMESFPVTYAGGIGSFADLEWIREAGQRRINVTIGSALDIFGGSMKFENVLDFIRR